jgi:hypothetical protein
MIFMIIVRPGVSAFLLMPENDTLMKENTLWCLFFQHGRNIITSKSNILEVAPPQVY